jgi:hypothetical protein
VDRVSVAQARVREVRAKLHSPERDLPCIRCRYFELVCTHPAVSRITVDPVTGAVKSDPLDAAKARADDGACGPEGALFDARSVPGQIAVAVLSTTLGRWGLFIAAAIALDILLR